MVRARGHCRQAGWQPLDLEERQMSINGGGTPPPASPEAVGEFLVMKGVQREVEKLLENDPDDPQVFGDQESEGDEGDEAMPWYEENDAEEEEEEEAPDLKTSGERATAKIQVAELPRDRSDATMLRTDLTKRGVENSMHMEYHGVPWRRKEAVGGTPLVRGPGATERRAKRQSPSRC